MLLRPVWSSVLEPLDSADQVDGLWIDRRKRPVGATSRIRVTAQLVFPDRLPYHAHLALDESGSMVPGSNDANDKYKSNELLSPDDPSKVDLPPWRAFRFVPFDENKHGGLGEKKSPASQKSEP